MPVKFDLIFGKSNISFVLMENKLLIIKTTTQYS